jgi:hypothetical protein
MKGVLDLHRFHRMNLPLFNSPYGFGALSPPTSGQKHRRQQHVRGVAAAVKASNTADGNTFG